MLQGVGSNIARRAADCIACEVCQLSLPAVQVSKLDPNVAEADAKSAVIRVIDNYIQVRHIRRLMTQLELDARIRCCYATVAYQASICYPVRFHGAAQCSLQANTVDFSPHSPHCVK